MENTEERCACCGLVASQVEGPTDPYGASSPSCWAAFGELQAKGLPQLCLDAYMAQHPGLTTPADKRSVLAHLVGLWCGLELAVPGNQIRVALGFVFPDKRAPPEISAVPPLSGLNVKSVLDAPPAERGARAEAWARFVWNAWGAEHPRVRTLGGEALKRLR